MSCTCEISFSYYFYINSLLKSFKNTGSSSGFGIGNTVAKLRYEL